MEESSSAELMTETDYVHWFTNNELENLLKETGSTIVMIKIKNWVCSLEQIWRAPSGSYPQFDEYTTMMGQF